MTHPRNRRRPCAFTVVACHGGRCCPPAELPVTTELAAAVRRCPHGVLVVSGCQLGSTLCLAWRHRSSPLPGTVLVVQPCVAADRQPRGPAIWLGPVRTQQDLTTVCHWLEGGQLDRQTLPAHLRTLSPYLGDASWN